MKNEHRFLEVAIDAVKEAGKIQKKYFGHFHQIEYKGEINPVTEVDRQCERAITQIVLNAYPHHDILAEEGAFEKKNSPYKWIIDPLDGTTNYLHGFPIFSVSIGLEIEGEIRVGVVYLPILEEMFFAEKGKGAFLNGQRITVSQTAQLKESLLGTGFPYDVHEHVDDYLRYFREFIIKSFAIRRPGSASIDLAYVAAGRFDGFWELKLHPWDVAAGCLLVKEAGGSVTDFKGQPVNIYSEEILASNGLIHKEMLRVIQEVNKRSASGIAQSAK